MYSSNSLKIKIQNKCWTIKFLKCYKKGHICWDSIYTSHNIISFNCLNIVYSFFFNLTNINKILEY